ncbi:MAG: hypothetical protein COS99_03310 [Candidatus Omnitrophica bacterium CG07_land_8_20_14_0_80_42_15]|uniref:methylated-DNA--[protein]-cysteine S-methyltransferase n=1 Tax=Candidatus Aquitaenariimonas noxiae TaxID=1974741 RepID=A0A2J0KWW9_9BACT|nr:MAG: hypothetical protein COS99_03310 [Candidatus Omnitrophica bacterium CG07_land_8_20_14_0_80_42_15]
MSRNITRLLKDQKLTPFQKRVLLVTCKIPKGQVRSYKWVAKKAGSPKSFRAVGQVLKINPFPITIPCHRVVKNGGTLGGFALGAKKKEELLLKEGLTVEGGVVIINRRKE